MPLSDPDLWAQLARLVFGVEEVEPSQRFAVKQAVFLSVYRDGADIVLPIDPSRLTPELMASISAKLTEIHTEARIRLGANSFAMWPRCPLPWEHN